MLQMQLIGANLYAGGAAVLKMAILLEWPRIFVPKGTRNSFYWTCRIVLGVHIAVYIGALLAINLACIPPKRIWDFTVPGGKCIDIQPSTIILALFLALSDILIILLPQRVIWQLHMSTRKKAQVSLLFCVGLL